MNTSLRGLRDDKRVMTYAAAGIYGAAALDGAVEGLLPGDPPFSWTPIVAVFAVFAILLMVGTRLPRRVLALLGPLGVAIISYALATTPGAGDGAVLYALPVLWMTLFFGGVGAAAILGCVAAGHVIVLLELPAASSYPGRWVDVMIAVSAVAGVILALQRHNTALVRQLENESRTDTLTGLLNRRGFDERVQIELAHARRDGRTMAVATFDIDYFKRVNDEWGHDTGDRVLAHVGRTLVAETREIDVTARLGGEEFVVLLPGSDGHQADALTQRVRRTLLRSDAGDDLPQVRVSAGVATMVDGEDVQGVLQRADSALYAAKRAGRDRTVVAPPAPRELPCSGAPRPGAGDPRADP